MTDPTADGWTLPEDLSDVALWEGEGGLWCGLESDGMVAIQSHWDGTTVTADDLLTIAARLTLLAHAINPPTHDPDLPDGFERHPDGTAWLLSPLEDRIPTEDAP